jgi:hypothetical protein
MISSIFSLGNQSRRDCQFRPTRTTHFHKVVRESGRFNSPTLWVFAQMAVSSQIEYKPRFQLSSEQTRKPQNSADQERRWQLPGAVSTTDGWQRQRAANAGIGWSGS